MSILRSLPSADLRWRTISKAARVRQLQAATPRFCPSLCSQGVPRCAPALSTTIRKPTGSATRTTDFISSLPTRPRACWVRNSRPWLLTASFKVFMTYDDLVLNDRQLLEVFDCARGCQALVMVHCEGYDAIRFMTDRLEQAGKTAPYYHAVSRPASVEREATHRAISHAELTDVPIMIVHVSGREPMEQIRWAQHKGLKIYGETCPQYVALTANDDTDLSLHETGAKYVCSPPA